MSWGWLLGPGYPWEIYQLKSRFVPALCLLPVSGYCAQMYCLILEALMVPLENKGCTHFSQGTEVKCSYMSALSCTSASIFEHPNKRGLICCVSGHPQLSLALLKISTHKISSLFCRCQILIRRLILGIHVWKCWSLSAFPFYNTMIFIVLL